MGVLSLDDFYKKWKPFVNAEGEVDADKGQPANEDPAVASKRYTALNNDLLLLDQPKDWHDDWTNNNVRLVPRTQNELFWVRNGNLCAGLWTNPRPLPLIQPSTKTLTIEPPTARDERRAFDAMMHDYGVESRDKVGAFDIKLSALDGDRAAALATAANATGTAGTLDGQEWSLLRLGGGVAGLPRPFFPKFLLDVYSGRDDFFVPDFAKRARQQMDQATDLIRNYDQRAALPVTKEEHLHAQSGGTFSSTSVTKKQSNLFSTSTTTTDHSSSSFSASLDYENISVTRQALLKSLAINLFDAELALQRTPLFEDAPNAQQCGAATVNVWPTNMPALEESYRELYRHLTTHLTADERAYLLHEISQLTADGARSTIKDGQQPVYTFGMPGEVANGRFLLSYMARYFHLQPLAE